MMKVRVRIMQIYGTNSTPAHTCTHNKRYFTLIYQICRVFVACAHVCERALLRVYCTCVCACVCCIAKKVNHCHTKKLNNKSKSISFVHILFSVKFSYISILELTWSFIFFHFFCQVCFSARNKIIQQSFDDSPNIQVEAKRNAKIDKMIFTYSLKIFTTNRIKWK